MSLSNIANRMLTIQSRKKVPLRAAFSAAVREDLATRFSIYNMVKSVTGSSLLAKVAKEKFKTQSPSERKAELDEKKKKVADQKFKEFTAASIVDLSSRLNSLTAIADRHTSLIAHLFNDVGFFRNQKKINPNTQIPSAKVPMRSKTAKGKIDELAREIEELKKQNSSSNKPKKPPKTMKEKKKQQDVDLAVKSASIGEEVLGALKTIGGVTGVAYVVSKVRSLFGGAAAVAGEAGVAGAAGAAGEAGIAGAAGAAGGERGDDHGAAGTGAAEQRQPGHAGCQRRWTAERGAGSGGGGSDHEQREH
jgi:hypothetical protein